ncbi:MAG: molecular chaperone HtpG, partial [Flavobacteriales bacterium]
SAAGERNYEVIELTTPLAAHLVGKLEQGMEKVKFVCVDSDAADKLIQKDEAIPSKLSDSEKDKLRPVIENVVDKSKFNVVFESMPETDQPFTVTQPEFSRRMKDMNALAGGAGTMPEMYNLLVNNNHPLVVGLLKEKDKKKREQKIRQMSDLAMLAQNMLKGEQLTEFVRRSIETIK